LLKSDLMTMSKGMVKTNFGGSSFDRAEDDNLPEYDATIAGMARMFGTHVSNPAEPEVIAKVIWDAAIALLDSRKVLDDETFIDAMKKRMSS
jgi:hypothetical protein